MVSKLVIALLLLLSAAQCTIARQERALVADVWKNIVNAGKAITANATQEISQVQASTKAAVEKAIAKAAEDFEIFRAKVAESIKAGIEKARSVAEDIRAKYEEGAEGLRSGIDAVIQATKKSVEEAIEQAKQKGANVAKCVSDYNGNVSAIANQTRLGFQDCAAPFTSPVADRIGKIIELNNQSDRVSRNAEVEFVDCRRKLSLKCYVEVVQKAMDLQKQIDSAVMENLKQLIPESLLARGAVESCAAKSAITAGEELRTTIADSLQCLRAA